MISSIPAITKSLLLLTLGLLLMPSSSNAQTNAAAPAAADGVLTPAPPATPRINGARIFGARPGSPFSYRIPATGQRPMTFGASGLPTGLSVDPQSGQVTGKVDAAGEYQVTLQAKNALGSAERPFKIVIGEDLLLTPPMGWNSWYILSEAVSDDWVRRMAKAMVDSGLADHGWTYINIDDTWQGPRGGPYHALQGNEKFPDLKATSAYVHSVGLKMGIIPRRGWAPTPAFAAVPRPTPKAPMRAHCLPPDHRRQPNQIFGRFPGFESFQAGKIGPYPFFDQDAKQWADWDIDYVKYDWHPIDARTVEVLADSLRHCGRDIAFSVSNGAGLDAGPALRKFAQVWRTGGDIDDSWSNVASRFQTAAWAPYTAPGHWPDLDMLQVGVLGKANTAGEGHAKTRLTPDEQYSHISFWALASAPLLLSCDLEKLDAFTIGLLTNDEVIDIDQDIAGKPAVPVGKQNGQLVYMKPLSDGSTAVGLFNLGSAPASIAVNFSDLNLKGKCHVHDVWRQSELGDFEDKYAATVPAHGVCLIKLTALP